MLKRKSETGYLYFHYRNDTGEIFYVGIGTDDNNFSRSRSRCGRNKRWRNIVNSVGYTIEIVFQNMPIAWILMKEIEFIALYGREDLGRGKLANFTDGGEWMSESDRKAQSTRKRQKVIDNEEGIEYEFIDPSGNLIKGRNLKELGRKYGVSPENLGRILRGVIQRCNGFTLPSYIPSEYTLISPTNEKLVFSNITHFAKEHSLDISSLSAVLSGKRPHHGGWHLENPKPDFIKTIQTYLFWKFTTVELYNPAGELLVINNLSKFYISNNFSREQVIYFLQNRAYFLYGYASTNILYSTNFGEKIVFDNPCKFIIENNISKARFTKWVKEGKISVKVINKIYHLLDEGRAF